MIQQLHGGKHYGSINYFLPTCFQALNVFDDEKECTSMQPHAPPMVIMTTETITCDVNKLNL